MIVGFGQEVEPPKPVQMIPVVEKTVDGRRIMVATPLFVSALREGLARRSVGPEIAMTVRAGSATITMPSVDVLEEGKSGPGAMAWVNGVLEAGLGVIGLRTKTPCSGPPTCERIAAATLDQASSLSTNDAGIVLLEPPKWRTGWSTGAMVAVGVGVVGIIGLGAWALSRKKR